MHLDSQLQITSDCVADPQYAAVCQSQVTIQFPLLVMTLHHQMAQQFQLASIKAFVQWYIIRRTLVGL
jgi:hypothetical protein